MSLWRCDAGQVPIENTVSKSELIEPLDGRKRMKFEDMAYAKFGAAMSKKQIKHWNKIRSEMWSLADYILDRSRLHDFDKKADRLRSLIEQLPIFDADGKGFVRTGHAIQDFQRGICVKLSL